MVSFITLLQVFVCLLMVALILLQPSKGGSFFTASNQGVFGSSGGTTFLFRATMWCGVFLAVTCLFLTWFKVHESGQSIINDTSVTLPSKSLPANSTAPMDPAGAPSTSVPTAPAGNGPTAKPVVPAAPPK